MTALGNITERIRMVGGLTKVISDDKIILVGGMSRSGTTLLTTVLDAHPEIACGAELLPPEYPSLSAMLEKLDSSLKSTDEDFSMVGRYLRQQGDRDLGLFLVRCYRAGLTHQEVRQAFSRLAHDITGPIDSLAKRLYVAQAAMQLRSRREGAITYGFKYTSSATDVAQSYLPNSILLCIIRDPRDVVLSHQKRGFDRTVEKICETWNVYTEKYRQFMKEHPEKCCVIRYEDLVRQPRRTLMKVFSILPVDLHPDVFEFYRSDSPIHEGFHPNAERLRMNFSSDGIGRAREELPNKILKEIESICYEEIQANGYDNIGYINRKCVSNLKDAYRIENEMRNEQREKFKRKRKFTSDDYAQLLEPYVGNYEIITMGDYVRETKVENRKILMIRHDIDHDLENGLRIAKWEADRGIRATYCLLHTAWYYGELVNDRYVHSDFLLEGIERISEMGHEINFHNNLIALALREDVDPIILLESELEFYDSLGVPVTGTSTHGDALCRELNFRNWELFKECCDDRFGGPRTVRHVVNEETREYELGKYSMFDFGLEYEAYDISKDFYHTESGGNMRLRKDTKGRRKFGREKVGNSSICGILTHPIWWDFGE